ncbi:hypothetical protein JHK82_016067 [Glycine max]|nr:hypothetical protein JHK82_016067 [Glycine max]
MVSTRFGIRSETPLADSHPHPATMIDAHTLQQLQNRNAEMEQCHEEELTKLEAHVRCPRGDEQSAHTLAKCTQGESHPRHTGNTADDLSPSYMHHQATWTIRWHPFINHIMEVDIPLGWKPLNLERYDGTIDPYEHLDAFLTQANLYTNDDAILCCVFLSSLKGATLTWYGGLPPRSIGSFDTLVELFNAQYATSRSHRMTSSTLANLRQANNESLQKFMDRFRCTTLQIQNLNLEVALHSMLLALPGKFVHNLCRKPPGSMGELFERAKSYIQMEQMSQFLSEVRQTE